MPQSNVSVEGWYKRVTENSVPTADRTPWFAGDTHPVRVGWFERIFIDGVFRHYWDGQMWLIDKGGEPHWRQIGEYPAWRGLKKFAYNRHQMLVEEFKRIVKKHNESF